MKLPLIAAATVALAGLLVASMPGPAAASAYPPVKSRQLTHNKLYSTGAFAPGTCKLPAMPKRSHKAVGHYLNTSYACLNAAWGAHLTADGIGFGKPSFTYYTKGNVPFCGGKVQDIVPGAYCNTNGQIAVILPAPVREYAPEVGFLLVMAHEYGHHVQNATGMWTALTKERFKDKKHLTEALRRYELQADCLAGVYVSSIWDSQGRSVPEWGALIAIAWSLGGDKGSASNDHGTRANRASWFNKGFAAETPNVCNTWVAPADKVA